MDQKKLQIICICSVKSFVSIWISRVRISWNTLRSPLFRVFKTSYLKSPSWAGINPTIVLKKSFIICILWALYEFIRKKGGSPNLWIRKRKNSSASQTRCPSKNKVKDRVKKVLKKKLKHCGFIYLHEIQALMPDWYSLQIDLLPILNKIQFLDVQLIRASGMMLITVTWGSKYISSFTILYIYIFCCVQYRPQNKVS